MLDDADHEALLSTFYSPSNEDEEKLEALISEEDAKIKALESEISSAEAILVELRKRKGERSKKSATARSLMAPVRKLPHGLLSDIFLLCLPRIVPQNLCGFAPIAWLRLFQDNHPNHARGTLALVCRLWRSVVDTSPRLWTTIAIYGPGPYPEKHDPSQVEVALRRSGTTLIDIAIQATSTSIIYGEYLSEIVPLLVKNLDRIRTLSLSMDLEYGTYVSDFFPRNKRITAPNLKYLRLATTRVPWQMQYGLDIGLIYVPKLVRLTWRRIPGLASSSFQ